MPGEKQEFEISFEEMLRLKPIIKTQTEAMEIDGAPDGKWWLNKMVTTLNSDGIKVIATATKAD